MADLRMPEINHVVLSGRLTRDPELRYIPSGTAVCKIGLAVGRHFRGRDGERREDTVFIDVTAWDKQAEYLGERLRQGSPIVVEGALKQDSWEDKQTGQKRSKIEVRAWRIQELAWSDRGSGPTGPAPAEPERPAGREEEPPAEDDIPF